MREIRTCGLTRGRALRDIRGVPLYSTANTPKNAGRITAVTMCTTAMEIIFCCFSERDKRVYEMLLEGVK